MKQNKKIQSKARREHRTRIKIVGKFLRPRLSVYRSHKSIYVQIIDDNKGTTLTAAHSREIPKASSRLEQAERLGKNIAKKALDKKITEVVFDRGSYKYHGLVKAISEGARKAGLKF